MNIISCCELVEGCADSCDGAERVWLKPTGGTTDAKIEVPFSLLGSQPCSQDTVFFLEADNYCKTLKVACVKLLKELVLV